MRYTTDKIRNIALIGHSGEGKTTLAEAMLYNAKQINRMGRPEDGNTIMDFEDEEIKRQISIGLSVGYVPWKENKINIIDVPGFFDFEGELVSALEVVGAAVIVTSACGEVTVGTEKMIDEVNRRNLPGLIFINQVDKENYNFTKTYNAIHDMYPGKVALINAPIMKDNKVVGFANMLDKKAYDFENNEVAMPEYLKDKVDNFHTQIVELAAESDEKLMEKYFSGELLSTKEIAYGIKKRQIDDGILIVMGGSALQNKGVINLLDEILQCMRNPEELEPKAAKNSKGDKVLVKTLSSEPLTLQVFKSIADPFVGKLSLFKVVSGVVKSGMTVKNTTQNEQEKLGTLYILTGKKQETVTELEAGDIGAVAKLVHTKTGDTLCDLSSDVIFDPLDFPKPVISKAVFAKKDGEDEKVINGLNKLEDEDSTFTLEKNAETGETIISGLGETHLDVLCQKLKRKFKVEAQLVNPKIAYRETIRKYVESEGKHKKQSGGRGQFGHVHIKFSPIEGEGFEFDEEVVGGSVPKNYIPAVEKGLRECIMHGVLAGYPVVGLKAVLYDGSYHDVDSSELAFKLAASKSYKEGLKNASPAILEPIYRVSINVPESYMGDILGDLNKRRGKILGMENDEKRQIINAEVPYMEMFSYATELRSMTQGRGKFEMHFEKYDFMPENLAQKVIEKSQQED